MKMNLVLAAALAVVTSQAALAASEGGDTWSELQPKPYAHSTRALAVPAHAAASSVQRDYLYGAPGRSEGGDTWSEVQPQPYARSSQSPAFATVAPLSTLQHEKPSVYGTPAEGDFTDRTVRLGSGSRLINVAYGETVRFIVTGKNGSERSFAWRFDVSPAVSHVDLSDVAPADLDVQNVRVFVAPDARYRGG
jgi:Heavy-metal resistance protein CzcE